MRKQLAVVTVSTVLLTSCAQPREHSAVDVTPPPVVEVPIQTIFHQAMKAHMPQDAIISSGLPAREALQGATAEIMQYAPEPAECAGTVDPELMTTDDVVLGFSSAGEDQEHAAQTIVAADFASADEASAYFDARVEAWVQCPSVDLTIDATNVLTLHYDSQSLTAVEDLEVSELLRTADQDMVVTSSGELSGAFETDDTTIPNPGALPDYVISPDEVPEPEAENIAISNATLVTRFDTQVFWMTIEPGNQLEQAVETLDAIVETVQAEA